MRIEFSKLAQADLEGIFDFTVEHWSQSQARSYIKTIRTTIDQISQGLAHTRKIPERPKIEMTRVDSHYVVFTKSDTLLTVHRILHVSMDTLAYI